MLFQEELGHFAFLLVGFVDEDLPVDLRNLLHAVARGNSLLLPSQRSDKDHETSEDVAFYGVEALIAAVEHLEEEGWQCAAVVGRFWGDQVHVELLLSILFVFIRVKGIPILDHFGDDFDEFLSEGFQTRGLEIFGGHVIVGAEQVSIH